MFKITNFLENDDIRILQEDGAFRTIEYLRDLSVSAREAQAAYFQAQMNIRKRQVVCDLNKSPVTIQKGAMAWTVGNVQFTTGVKGAKDLFGKIARSNVTGESAIKPEYSGTGILVLEPTYRHLIIVDVGQWNGSIVLEDGLFLACESQLKHRTQMRSNFSSASLGGEGFFNLELQGNGKVVLESHVPREELVEVELQNDELRVDGPNALAWSGSLEFTVEKSTKSLMGSAFSGEGLVNVYRGTGKVLMAPVIDDIVVEPETTTES
ncbi:MAG: AIM24 family protein [Tissierellia bacterium]|nr:AIM24 family protein [Tissierellia bacterium]